METGINIIYSSFICETNPHIIAIPGSLSPLPRSVEVEVIALIPPDFKMLSDACQVVAG